MRGREEDGFNRENTKQDGKGRCWYRHWWVIPLAAWIVAGGTLFAYVQNVRSTPPTRNECVILLHGLYRSSVSMSLIEHDLMRQGFAVINIDYATTQKSITEVAENEVTEAVSRCREKGYDRIHFVTHSLGAIVVRSYLQDHHLPQGSRIVMLAPPNQGSELADWGQALFPRLLEMSGPAVNQLGTQGQTFTSNLNPITPEVGVVIGNDSWNPLFSKLLPGNDDGAVSIERAKLKEMKDFLVAPCNHTSIILDSEVREQVLHFLQRGGFRK